MESARRTGLLVLNRGVVMHDGTLVVSVYTQDHDGDERPVRAALG